MIIDLGRDSRFSHLRYLPRQDNSQVGNIKGYRLYASDNPYGGWVEVADGSFAADNKLKMQVLKPKESNLPPLAQIDGKTEAEAGERVVLDASASSDPQGAALSYAWSVSPALDMELDGPRLSFVAPSLAQDTTYRFTLTLDNGKQRVTRDHEVKVKAAQDASCRPAWMRNKAYLSGDMVQHGGASTMRAGGPRARSRVTRTSPVAMAAARSGATTVPVSRAKCRRRWRRSVARPTSRRASGWFWTLPGRAIRTALSWATSGACRRRWRSKPTVRA